MNFDIASIRAAHRKQARAFLREADAERSARRASASAAPADRQDVAERARALRRQQDRIAKEALLDLHQPWDWDEYALAADGLHARAR